MCQKKSSMLSAAKLSSTSSSPVPLCQMTSLGVISVWGTLSAKQLQLATLGTCLDAQFYKGAPDYAALISLPLCDCRIIVSGRFHQAGLILKLLHLLPSGHHNPKPKICWNSAAKKCSEYLAEEGACRSWRQVTSLKQNQFVGQNLLRQLHCGSTRSHLFLGGIVDTSENNGFYGFFVRLWMVIN